MTKRTVTCCDSRHCLVAAHNGCGKPMHAIIYTASGGERYGVVTSLRGECRYAVDMIFAGPFAR